VIRDTHERGKNYNGTRFSDRATATCAGQNYFVINTRVCVIGDICIRFECKRVQNVGGSRVDAQTKCVLCKYNCIVLLSTRVFHTERYEMDLDGCFCTFERTRKRMMLIISPEERIIVIIRLKTGERP